MQQARHSIPRWQISSSSSAIEDERLNALSVRSSLARRLGVSEEQPYAISDRSEGLAAMILDAIDNRHQPLTLERLLQWHHWLFPADDWTLQRVRVGQLRGEEPMQMVSVRLSGGADFQESTAAPSSPKIFNSFRDSKPISLLPMRCPSLTPRLSGYRRASSVTRGNNYHPWPPS
ncbi:TPA: DUF4172 domain-containing protein [Aeromonas veronii]